MKKFYSFALCIATVLSCIFISPARAQQPYDEWYPIGQLEYKEFSKYWGTTKYATRGKEWYALPTSSNSIPFGILYSNTLLGTVSTVQFPSYIKAGMGYTTSLFTSSKYVFVVSLYSTASKLTHIRTSDNGKTWEQFATNELWSDMQAVQMLNNDSVIVARLSDYVIAVSTNSGDTWAMRDLTAYKMSSIFFDNGVLYSAQENRGLCMSNDIGRTWNLIGTKGLNRSASRYTVANSDDKAIFCNIGLDGIYQWKSDASEWKKCRFFSNDTLDGFFTLNRNPRSGTLHMAVEALSLGKARIGIGYFHSVDNGVTWRRTTLPENLQFEDLYQYMIDSVYILVNDATHIISTDDGVTWIKYSDDLASSSMIYAKSSKFSLAYSKYYMIDSANTLYSYQYECRRLCWSKIRLPDQATMIQSIAPCVDHMSYTNHPLRGVPTFPMLLISDLNGVVHRNKDLDSFSIRQWESFDLNIKAVCSYIASDTASWSTRYLFGVKGGIITSSDLSITRYYEFPDPEETVNTFAQVGRFYFAVTNTRTNVKIWRSTTFGRTWQNVALQSLQVNSAAFLGNGTIVLATTNGVWTFSSNDSTWKLIQFGGKNVKTITKIGQTICCMVTIDDEGVYLSEYPFNKWNQINQGLPSGTLEFLSAEYVSTSGQATQKEVSVFVTLRAKGIHRYVSSKTYTTDTLTMNQSIVSVNEPLADLEILALYPNPITDELTVHADTELQRVEVYSLLGEKVIDISHQATNRITIPVTALPRGAYRVVVHQTGSAVPLSRMVVRD
ncbi:MAG: T9SS type A sorting domain-containing protein [Candidatus Kapabacteria bacterium]|nr:T9SS type A sorting domain-containing protein [Candidatus Kapabacteria bacterium]